MKFNSIFVKALGIPLKRRRQIFNIFLFTTYVYMLYHTLCNVTRATLSDVVKQGSSRAHTHTRTHTHTHTRARARFFFAAIHTGYFISNVKYFNIKFLDGTRD